MHLVRRKPLTSLAKRTYGRKTRMQKLQGRRLKAAKRSYQRAAWQFQQIMEKQGERKKSNRKSIESAAGIRLMPETQYAMQEIMYALEQGMLPKRFRKLKLNQAEQAELFGLLLKYYQEGIEANSFEWKRLEHILKIGRKGSVQARKSLSRTPANISIINKQERYRKAA